MPIPLFFLVSLFGVVVPLAGPARASDQPRRIVGYYASWSAYKGFYPDNIAVDYLTHFVYAFANISDNGTVILGDPCIDVGDCSRDDQFEVRDGNLDRLKNLKKHHAHLKMLVAIGGWNWSKRFSDVALTQQSRERFVQSAIEVLLDPWPDLFDGFDLDWEFPVEGGHPENIYRTEDKTNYTQLIAEFRRQLDRRASEYHRPFLLTVAMPAAMDMMKNMEIAQIQKYADWLNIMTYDYHTGGGITHFNSPLYSAADDPTSSLNVHATIQTYLGSGSPPEKLVLGIPFFGYKYRGVAAHHNGLFEHFDGREYFLLRNLQVVAGNGYRRFWESRSQVPWIYNQESGTWLTYEDVDSVLAETQYVRRYALGGAMIWELSGDDGVLLKSIASSLNK